MKSEIIQCDGCLSEIRNGRSFKQKGSGNMVDFCSVCLGCVVMNFLDSRGDRPLMSQCDCLKGRVQVKDMESTYSAASCGENRTHYKWIDCEKCKF